MFSKSFKFLITISIVSISLAGNACVEEGKSVGVYPNAPQCCKGLELQPAPPGVYGSAGTCVVSRRPSSPNVNDSRIQAKDYLPSSSPSPSKGSSASHQ